MYRAISAAANSPIVSFVFVVELFTGKQQVTPRAKRLRMVRGQTGSETAKIEERFCRARTDQKVKRPPTVGARLLL
jgi:hypothetical protein